METQDLARGARTGTVARPVPSDLAARHAAAVNAVRGGSQDPRVLVALLEGLARGDQELREATTKVLAEVPRRQLAMLRAAALAAYGRSGALSL